MLKPMFVVLISCIFLMLAGGCDKTEDETNKPPSCLITNPKNGDEILSGAIINIVAQAADNDGEIKEVVFVIDNVEVGTPQVLVHEYQWNTAGAATGKHTLKATAKDNSNNVSSHEIAIFIIEEGSSTLETGTVNDYDGNTYKTVKIGTQWWMAENLKTTHFSDGTDINFIENPIAWDNLTLSDKAFCFYNDSLSYAGKYGAIYNWAAAMNGAESSETTPSQVRGVCPDGWHLPSDPEWIVMEMQLGMSYEEAWLLGWRGTNEGTKMKAKEGWNENGNGTNSSGFSALPAGIRSNNGLFSDAGKITHFWSTTEYINITSYAFNRQLNYNHSGVGWFYASHYYGYPKDFGFSVRCVKD